MIANIQSETRSREIANVRTEMMTRRSVGSAWRSPWLSAVVSLVLVSYAVQEVVAEGSIGCLFAQSLCIDSVEICFDDYAFGKCVSRFDNDVEDMRRSRLTIGQSKVLATMLQEMQGAGLTWDHPFVQCRMQGAIFALREKTPMPPNLCGHLAPPPEMLDPQGLLAYVRFTPPEEDYLDEEAEEFYPPEKKSALSERVFLIPRPPPPSNPYDVNYDELELLDQLQKQEEEAEEEDNREAEELTDRFQLEKLMRLAQERAMQEVDPIVPISRGSFFHERQRQLESDALNDMATAPMAPSEEKQEMPKRKGADNEPPHTSFREVSRVEHIPAVSYYHEPHRALEDGDWANDAAQLLWAKDEEPDSVALAAAAAARAAESESAPESSNAGGIYTEGGVVYLSPGQERSAAGGEQQELDMDEQVGESESREEARSLLANMLGFTRHERLDVKKPGPLVVPPEVVIPAATSNQSAKNKEILPDTVATLSPSKTKKLIIDAHETADHAVHSVDPQFAHVKFTTPVDTWRDGKRIVQAIGEQMNLVGFLSHIRVDQHEVSFRVDKNPEGRTATNVANAINDPRFKTNLFRRLGVTVLYAGIGDKTQASELNEQMSQKMVAMTQDGGIDSTHLMVYMFVGAGVAAIVVAVITLFVIKRHDAVKSKLMGLTGGVGMRGAGSAGGGSVDSSKDYQELCRARMAGKGGPNGNEQSATSGRITSLTKENERPPSSRSSTSSWSEEPITNMDISTGHMVLSYMEDHLRNKGRLQREWEALCRYEAEPNSRDAALQDSAEKMNRDGAPLPFDHSRVVLNHLANAEGSDYINASTITDHDPRAPAYVAAQGPMQSTIADFWQMIWEQGTVVIVALCRLQENGEISCTRYWPEEGAETYHIYEVHLVSEHIWCDDYLVRSFYLKNLQTGETRTVTQFHFLTWPQMGVPASAKPLLEFRRKVNKSYRGRSCPIVVHSGNGAGRTGAYILLDLVLGRMNKGAREIDIAATLEHLRDQRAGLVETRPQFEFVLMAVAEEVHAILKALPNTTSTEKRDIDKDPIKEEEKVPLKSGAAAAAEEKKKKVVEGAQEKDKAEKEKRGGKEESGGGKGKK